MTNNSFILGKRILRIFLPNKKKYLFYKQLSYKEQSLTEGEMEFFRHIKGDLKIMIDVGPRTDTYYAENSENLFIHYFEPNPYFCRILSKKLSTGSRDFKLNNIGLSDKEEQLYYYHDSQSFLEISAVKNKSYARSKNKIELKTLNSFNFENIDFLKIDTEEFDYFVLKGATELLTKIKYLQFELGLAKIDNHKRLTNQDYFDLLNPNFDLYILRDENNPIWKANIEKRLLLKLEGDLFRILIMLQSLGIGFNIVGINKNLKKIPNL